MSEAKQQPTVGAIDVTGTATGDSAAGKSGENAPGHDGDYYFDSYGHYGIHMEMLKDAHRTTSYRDAIMMNSYMFKDKIVMDVGCGTGILSMFAAKAGAKHVLAVECSSIAHQAREIIKENGFEDKITVLHGKLEELTLPNGIEKVDIIISEWMGYFLLYESMLNTVLIARDKFGADDVKLLPDSANMYATAITDPHYVQDRFEIWNNVHGLDFSYFKRLSYIEPLIDSVDKKQVMSSTATMFSFQLNSVKEEDLAFNSEFKLTATRDDTVHAICVHFDTPFCAGHDVVILDTAPWSTTTHWRQTVFYLINPIQMNKGEVMHCKLNSKPNPDNHRDLDVRLRVDFDGLMQVSHFDQDFRVR